MSKPQLGAWWCEEQGGAGGFRTDPSYSMRRYVWPCEFMRTTRVPKPLEARGS